MRQTKSYQRSKKSAAPRLRLGQTLRLRKTLSGCFVKWIKNSILLLQSLTMQVFFKSNVKLSILTGRDFNGFLRRIQLAQYFVHAKRSNVCREAMVGRVVPS